jgi:hypothetical protein
MKRLNRFQLRDIFIAREYISRKYLANINLSEMPQWIDKQELREVIEWAWLMGYNAHETKTAREKRRSNRAG